MYEIFPMNQNHLDQIMLIEKESFSIPWSKKQFEEELKNELAIYIVCVYNSEVAGYAGMWRILDEGHITNVAVKEDFRKIGIGDFMIKSLFEVARKNDIKSLTLEVRISNLVAQRLYTKNGFKIYGLRKNYYTDTMEDAIVMWSFI